MSIYIKQPLRKSNTKIQKKSRKSPAMIKVGLILKIQRFSKHIKSNKRNLSINYMIILINSEKAFNKIKHAFMI